MAQRITWWFLIMATLFGVPTAFAQTGSSAPEPVPLQQLPMQPAATQPRGEAVAKFRAACGQEVRRFCTGVQPGGGRIMQCLLARRGELSAPCRSVLVAARPAPAVSPNPGAQSPASKRAATAGGFQASCGPDAQRLCAGMPRENGSVVKCLTSHRTELSATCTSFFVEKRAQRAAQKNTHPPPARPADTPSGAPADMPEAAPPPAADVPGDQFER